MTTTFMTHMVLFIVGMALGWRMETIRRSFRPGSRGFFVGGPDEQ